MTRLAIIFALLTGPAFADAPIIEGVKASKSGSAWRFDVTLRHADTGWEDYANAWEVRLPDGTVLGTRVLAHPHVQEQPFTRSLSGVSIPQSVTQVLVFASDLKTGFGDTGKLVDLR